MHKAKNKQIKSKVKKGRKTREGGTVIIPARTCSTQVISTVLNAILVAPVTEGVDRFCDIFGYIFFKLLLINFVIT